MSGCFTHKVYFGFADIDIKPLFEMKWLVPWIVYLTNIPGIVRALRSPYFNKFHSNAVKRIHDLSLNSRIKALLYHNTKIPRNCIELKLLFTKWVFSFSIVINLKNNRAQRCLFIVFLRMGWYNLDKNHYVLQYPMEL